MSAGEGINYWLRTPELGDPVESYTKGACPDPQIGLAGSCDEGAGRASYNVGDGSSPLRSSIWLRFFLINGRAKFLLYPNSDRRSY